MNRLNIVETVNLGGHKMSLNDLNTLQLGTLDVASAIAFIVGEGGNNIVLSQLNIDDRTSDFDLELPAMVYYNSKVYRVDAAFAQGKAVGGAYKFRIDTAVDADNPVSYQDGTPFNVHIEETMTLVHTTLTGTNYVPLSTFQSFNGWTEETPTTNNLSFDDPGDEIIMRWRVEGRTMRMHLEIQGSIESAGIISVNLPWSYSAARTYKFNAVGMYGGTFSNYAGQINAGDAALAFSLWNTNFSANTITLVMQLDFEIKYQ